MTEAAAEGKTSFPYMSAAQWYGVRGRLRQSVPKTIDVDWLMGTLGTSEKGARNILPQLKAIGIIHADGKTTDLALDLRDDEHYPQTCDSILESLYPESLRQAYDSADADAEQVARWFMRNAGTGEAAAKMQARLYLTLLRRELPAEDEKVKPPRKRAAKKTAATKVTPAPATGSTGDTAPANDSNGVGSVEPVQVVQPNPSQALGPALHIDLQIHISADASDTQIDAVFKSMAKHLYGRE